MDCGTGAGTHSMEAEPQGMGTHRVPLWGTREGWLLEQIIFFASIVMDL